MTTAPVPSSNRRSTAIALILGLLLSAMVALVTAFVVSRVMYESFKVPAGSMLPTLPPGAHVWSHRRDAPERGAVMVFRFPENRRETFVKRVVGMPGETIEVRHDAVTINGWSVPRCELGPWSTTVAGETHEGTLWLEHLGALSYLVFIEDSTGADEHQGPFKVAAGEYFVLGDNRRNSYDSRLWNGGAGAGVPAADMRGRVRSADDATLPPGADDLRAAFDACMAKRPAKTTP